MYLRFLGYDLCIITKRLNLAIENKLKDKHLMTKKNHFLGLNIKIGIFTQTKNTKWIHFAIKKKLSCENFKKIAL